MTTPLLKLTIADIKEWCYLLIKKYQLTKKAFYSATTILRQVYDYLIEQSITEKNPCISVKINPTAFRKAEKKPAETQIFYQDEIELIIQESIRRAKEDLDIGYLCIPFFFYTGVRIGECLALTFSDCDKDTHSIYIHRMLAVIDERLPDGTWAPRRFEIVDYLKGNGDPRTVLVADQGFDIINMVKDFQYKCRRISDLLFPDIAESNVEYKLYRICKTLGLTERSPHKWRKTYISTLLNKGVDADFVRRQVGHKDLQTTLNSYTYSTTRQEQQLEQLNKLLSVSV